MDEMQFFYSLAAQPAGQNAICIAPNRIHQNIIGAHKYSGQPPRRLGLRGQLAATIADNHYITVLFDQPEYSLVIVHTAVRQAYNSVRIEAFKFNRGENTRSSTGRSDSREQLNLIVWAWRLSVVHATKPFGRIYHRLDTGRRFAHIGCRELPVMSCVQRGSIQD